MSTEKRELSPEEIKKLSEERVKDSEEAEAMARNSDIYRTSETRMKREAQILKQKDNPGLAHMVEESAEKRSKTADLFEEMARVEHRVSKMRKDELLQREKFVSTELRAIERRLHELADQETKRKNH